LAQKFDPKGLKLSGEPQPITDKVRSFQNVGGANFSVSHEGTLIMGTTDKTAQSELKWFDRTGRELAAIGEAGRFGNVAISPNGTQIAYTVEDDKNSTFDIWIRELNRNVASRLTFEPESEGWPIWTPDGQKVVYTKGDWPAFSTYSKSADGSGTAQLIPKPDTLIRIINDISPDGLNASYMTIRNSQPDIQICRLPADTNNVEIIASKFAEYGARFSPDGQYVAYTSEESGKPEIYVKRSDGTGGKWQVSTNGGAQAIWNRNGKELVYLTPDENFMAVSVNTKGTFESGTPVKLFRQRLGNLGEGANWDISSDGQKFLLITPQGTTSAPAFEIVLNWTKELEAR
jgi:Tol biopolymer transport system component